MANLSAASEKHDGEKHRVEDVELRVAVMI
jgi:hypothetical protein